MSATSLRQSPPLRALALRLEQAGRRWIAPDGLHPSPRAYAAWAESLLDLFLAK